MEAIKASITTVEALNELHQKKGPEDLASHIGDNGVFVRLDERGEDSDPALWAFREGANPTGYRDPPAATPDKNIWDELHLSNDENDPDKTEEITDEIGLGFPIPPARGAATVFLLPTVQERTKLLLGRGEDNQIQIVERSVSRQHASIELNPEIKGFYISDDHSRNGVKVRGRQIAAGTTMKVRHGDTLALGDIVFLFLSAEQFLKNLNHFMD